MEAAEDGLGAAGVEGGEEWAEEQLVERLEGERCGCQQRKHKGEFRDAVQH